MEFENLNFGMFGLVWLGYVKMAPKMLDLYTKIHKNAMVLKEPYISLTLTVLLV